MKDRIFGFTFATNSGIGSIPLSLKYGAYLSTLSFSYYSDILLFTAQETGVAGLLFMGVLCPGCMELAEIKGSLVSCEVISDS